MEAERLILMLINLLNTGLTILFNQRKRKLAGEVKDAVLEEIKPELQVVHEKLDIVLSLLPKEPRFKIHRNDNAHRPGKKAHS